ncbi:MAG: glycerol-3-phosphate dehydrogenase [Devosia sp.]
MATILILGAGVMGSAIAVPAADNGHSVRLAATPLDGAILTALTRSRDDHPRLGAPLPSAIEPVDAADLTAEDAAAADLIILGVSSPGIPWAVDTLARLEAGVPVALVTKGLVDNGEARPLTYAQALPQLLAERGITLPALVGIGGPCIARELAERRPTAVVYSGAPMEAAHQVRQLFQTPYYQIATSEDFVGIEACAAMKNFFTIGVSAMLGQHQRDGEPMKNPVAAAFQQAVDELEALAVWIGGQPGTAYGLSGVGDLHVTVGGGRNSRLGQMLGAGQTVAGAMNGPLQGETVEGVDVGRVLGPALRAAFTAGELDAGGFPLATAIIAAAESGGALHYDVAADPIIDQRRRA